MYWLPYRNEWRHSADRRSSQHHSARSRFREAVSGTVLSSDIIREGVETCIDYIEGQIFEYSVKSNGILDTFFQNTADPEERVTQLFDIAAKVAEMLINLDSHSSLEDMAKELIKCNQPKELSATGDRDVRCAEHLVFDCIGWISMCYIPSPSLTKTFFAMEKDAAKLSDLGRGSSSVTKRPLGAVLREFWPVQCRPETAHKHEPKLAGNILAVASLNYFTLHNIGKLSIDWTEKLSDHCLLDARRRQLKVFRFPAFCAQAYIGHRGEQILCRISQAHVCRQDCLSKTQSAVRQYLYEVLLSYRLLFGENKRSRTLFRAEESSRASRERLLYDPLLFKLCGRKDVGEIANIIPSVGDRVTFDALNDFPELGQRLQVLQEYIADQKPMSVRDIWNDHRDPQQTLAFWVVVIVGGATIFLGFLQVVVNIAQLVVAIRQIQPSR